MWVSKEYETRMNCLIKQLKNDHVIDSIYFMCSHSNVYFNFVTVYLM